MRNWSTDTTELKKDKNQYAVWKITQMVNFGLGKEKLNQKELKKYWPKLNLDSKKKNIYLSFYGPNDLKPRSTEITRSYQQRQNDLPVFLFDRRNRFGRILFTTSFIRGFGFFFGRRV